MRSLPSKETLSFPDPRSSLCYAPLTTLPSHHFSDQNDSRTSDFGSRTSEFGSRTGDFDSRTIEFGSPRSRDKIRSGSILESPQRRMMMSDIEGGGKEKESLRYQSHSRLILPTTSSDQDVLTQRQILLSMTSPDSSFLSSSRSITSNPVQSFPAEKNSTLALVGSGRQESPANAMSSRSSLLIILVDPVCLQPLSLIILPSLCHQLLLFIPLTGMKRENS